MAATPRTAGPGRVPEALETERLVLRCPDPQYAAAFVEAVQESLEDLRPWLDWAGEAPSLRAAEGMLRRARDLFRQGTDFYLLLFLKSTGELVGGSGLHRVVWEVPRFEIGYWCRRRFQGHGYITEAVRGLTTLTFEGLRANRVEIRCDPRNLRSRRVAERLGFRLEGELRNENRSPEGALRHTVVYSLVPEDYQALRGGPPRP